jgi:hypothetical protein
LEKRAKQGLPGSGGLGEEMVQTMYTHVRKCKNNKIKVEKTKRNDSKQANIKNLF